MTLTLEDIARRNRERFPDIARVVDQIRTTFPGAVVTYAGEAREATSERLRSASLSQSPSRS